MRITPRPLLLCIAAAGLAAVTQAQSLPQARGSQTPADFGTRVNILQMPAASFQPMCSALEYAYVGDGFMFLANNGCGPGLAMWAPVTLPTGSEILFLNLYYDDTDPANDISVYLRAFTSSGYEDLTFAGSTGSGGIGYTSSIPISYLVNNDAHYDPLGRQLAVMLYVPNASFALKFKGADLWWTRPVSPAPALATFNDVPTDHPFFQFVEALARAGVTSGCQAAPPLYCPDSPLTRGQMAVFLSKALGLSWYDALGAFGHE